MSFASEPSWKKHLFLLHRIKRPQPSDYCHDLTTENQPHPESRGNKVYNLDLCNSTIHIFEHS